MPTMTKPVLMPQMAEGTIVRWIKKVGDKVDRDEPLFEISTDKVDAEIPSPAAGVLSEIKVKEGETVAVNSIVATIGDAMAAAKKPQADTADGVAAAPTVGGADRLRRGFGEGGSPASTWRLDVGTSRGGARR